MQALVCLLAIAAPCRLARAATPSEGFAPASYIGEYDPGLVWDCCSAAIAAVSFLVAIGIWILAALRGAKSAQLRRSAFISSALNTLNQGVMITNARNRVVFFNDRFLEMYGLSRAEIPGSMTGRELLELRRARGLLRCHRRGIQQACPPPGRRRHRTAGRAIGACRSSSGCPMAGRSERMRIARSSASCRANWHRPRKFLESVLDNVPVCVAAKNIEDGRYIFANRAFERFSRFSRDHIIGKRADEIFRPETAKSIETADQAALTAPEGYHRSEYVVERGRRQARSLVQSRGRAQREQRA